MDPIRLLLSLILGLFPHLLHLTAIPLAVVSRGYSRQQLRDYAIGHDWFGWYRVTLEIRATGWPTLRVVAISEWSRMQPGGRRKTRDKSQSVHERTRKAHRLSEKSSDQNGRS